MTPRPNETPEPLAGPSVESCATALAEALRREKGWLLDYGHSVIRDAIDRKHLEPLEKEQAGEMKTVAYLVTNLSSGEPSICFEDERGDYGDEDHMPVFDELCRRSEFTAAIQSKDAEIAGLKADAGQRVPMVTTLFGTPGTLMFKATDGRWFYMNHADTWQSCPAPFAAAIRAQTGGEHG